jgi:hypothetical protein
MHWEYRVRSNDPNLTHLRDIAAALGSLRDEVVFVGGSTAGLLLSDPATAGIRATFDVDAIVDARSLPEYQRFERRLEEQGFVRDPDGTVICRWLHRPSGTVFDLMPVDPGVLGFSNPWYADAILTAKPMNLDGIAIRVISGPAFVATKMEAFRTRGNGDLFSHDLEDVLTVVDGRPELADELRVAPEALRNAVATALASVLNAADFQNVLPGLIADPNRAAVVKDRLQRIVELNR